MKAFLVAGAVSINTLLLTGALLWIDPFARVNALLDTAFGATPEWTQVTNLFRDPRTQDIQHGENPLLALQSLAEYWRTHPGKRRVVLVGNSQMFSVSLAPGEFPKSAPEHTYPDLVALRLQSEGVLTYRLAAPGLSYIEALYEIDYLLAHPDLRPSLVVLQMNYQAFWNSGIRDSFLELMTDPPFHQQVIRRTSAGKPYADDFSTAITKYGERDLQSGTPRVAAHTGYEFATVGMKQRCLQIRDSFEDMFYRGRIYFLRIKPSSARSIAGPQLTRSQAAVEAIAESCHAAGVPLAIFMAPVNPAVSLYRSPEDHWRYQVFVHTLAGLNRLPLADLESSVPAGLWGRQLNGPDPLHMGRAAHAMLGGMVAQFVRAALEGH